MHCKSVHGGWIWWVDLVGGSMAINKVPVTTSCAIGQFLEIFEDPNSNPLLRKMALTLTSTVNETLSW